MTTPENTKPFDLSLAQQGHPLVTRDGRKVKFIAYNPDVIYHQRIITKIDDEIVMYANSGVQPLVALKQWDLFLAPVGYCEGLPVFPNDVLIGTDDNSINKGKEFVVTVGCNTFTKFKWPSKNVVVKTRMTRPEILDIFNASPNDSEWETVANKAIERAIADGDVIPTSVVEKLVSKAVNLWATSSDSNLLNVKEQFDLVLRVYKEDLTK